MASFARRACLLTFLALALALVLRVPADAASSDGGVTVLRLAHSGPAFVVGPQHVQRMSVRVRGSTHVVGEAIPVGASRLGHGVTAVQLPPDLRPDEPIVVRIEPPGAGSPRILSDDPAIDTGVDSVRADGIMLGILFAVLFFQIAGWAITRDPSIPFYALFVATLGMIELLRDGLIPLPRAIPALPMLMLLDMINGFGTIGFIIVYLRLWQDDRRLFWIVLGGVAPEVLVGLALALVPGLQPHSEALRAPILLIGSLVLFGVALARARRFPPALSLSSALALVLLGVVYRAVRDLTPFANPFLDRWTFEIATSADALFFGFAVIVRSRYIVRERRVLEERLNAATNAAEHDPLTGALNRRGLFARAEAVAAGTLFFLDLDGFKPLNDRFGHSAGDRMLVEVVAALRRVVPQDALVARLGGDEFVVVTLEGPDQADVLAGRFAEAITAIQTPARLRGDGFGASVGHVSLAGMSLENALHIADAKTYRVKTSKRTSGVVRSPAPPG
jgi:diguanylate cyclase (GGDEF)-like protein